MILDHVTHRPRGVVVAGTPLDAERFNGGDLDMAHMAGVPDRLEDRVGKAHDHDVLRGLLTEIVVDPVGFAFGEDLVDQPVQRRGRCQILAERFFDDDARPASGGGSVESALAEMSQDHGELVWCNGQIVEAVAARAARAVGLLHLRRESAVSLGIVEGALVIVDGGGEAFPELLV